MTDDQEEKCNPTVSAPDQDFLEMVHVALMLRGKILVHPQYKGFVVNEDEMTKCIRGKLFMFIRLMFGGQQEKVASLQTKAAELIKTEANKVKLMLAACALVLMCLLYWQNQNRVCKLRSLLITQQEKVEDSPQEKEDIHIARKEADTQTKVLSLAQDLVYNITGGKKWTPKQVGLASTLHKVRDQKN